MGEEGKSYKVSEKKMQLFCETRLLNHFPKLLSYYYSNQNLFRIVCLAEGEERLGLCTK